MPASRIKFVAAMSAIHLTEGLTIGDLFSESEVGQDRQPDTAPENSAEGTSLDLATVLREEELVGLRKVVPVAISWGRVQTAVAEALGESLHTSLLETLAEGWKTYRSVMEAAHKSCESPSDLVLAPLAEHAIDSTLSPYVEVLVGPNTVAKLNFEATLTTTLKGLVLGLRAGAIVTIDLAHAEWSGTIAVEGVTLVERTLQELKLPASLKLKRPIFLGKALEGGNL